MVAYLSNLVIERAESRVAETGGFVIHWRELLGCLLDSVQDFYDRLHALYRFKRSGKYCPYEDAHKRTGDVVHSSFNLTPTTLSFRSSMKLTISSCTLELWKYSSCSFVRIVFLGSWKDMVCRNEEVVMDDVAVRGSTDIGHCHWQDDKSSRPGPLQTTRSPGVWGPADPPDPPDSANIHSHDHH